MTSKINFRNSIYFSIIVLLILLTSCADMFKDPSIDKDTGEDVTLLLMDRNFIKTKISVHLVDFLTQQPIENEDVQVLFYGDDAANLITFGGIKKNVFQTSTGLIEVGYDPNISFNAQNPIELTVVAGSSNYISAPQVVSYSTEGIKDLVIEMYRQNSLKSASILAFDEPYDLKFNGNAASTGLSFLTNISGASTGTAWKYINLYRTFSSGNLECKNLKDNVLYSDYGVYAVKLSAGTGIVPPAPPTKNIGLAVGDFVYSSILKSGLVKCDGGLTISVKSSKETGSGVFEYLITFSDGSKKTGKISCSFPSENLIEQVYYPASNPAVTVELFGDAQYSMSAPVSLTSPCSKASFTATPKSNLKTYKLITRYSCPNSPVGYGLSVMGEFRKKGSTGSWTSAQFIEGICVLQLEANTDYDFRVNLDGKYYSYTIPTDPVKVKTYLEGVSSNDFKFRNLEIITGSTTVTITVDVEFSDGVCDLIN
jgi:hypothetical protein